MLPVLSRARPRGEIPGTVSAPELTGTTAHPRRVLAENPGSGHPEFLLSTLYDDAQLHPDHLVDLRRSGITDETIRLQGIRSVPPGMIELLLGFRASAVRSAM